MSIAGRVVSLYVHPEKSGLPMLALSEMELVAEKGIAQEKRYFGRVSTFGKPSKRQVTLIEREQIAEHATALGSEVFPVGVVRSNIETEGIKLVPLSGRKVQIGSAVLEFGEPRTPCHKMDEIHQGLRALMEDSRQGVLAVVIRSGVVRIGDRIEPLDD